MYLNTFTEKRKSIINAAIKEAEKSTYNYQMGAVIFKGKKVISVGYNKGFAWSRKLHPRFKKWNTSIHCESAAILNARQDLKGADILVVRVNKNGEYRNARPCKHCLMYISYVGIRRVFFSISTFPYFEVMKI
jgi:deoxycytidylate deaminase